MKHLTLLVWLTQLGFSVAFPMAGFVLAAVWLRNRFDLGIWVLIVGIVLGLAGAIDGFRVSMKAMSRLTKKEDPEQKGGNHGHSYFHHS